MNNLFRYLATIVVFLSCAAPSFAQPAPRNDLAGRLEQERNEFKQLIETQRGPGLIQVADTLTGAGLSDETLYAAVNAKTQLLMAEHAADPKNDGVEEELNAMIRALGSMSVKSRDLIDGLVTSSTSRGVRNRALRLSSKLYWFEQRNAIMQKPEFYQPGQDLMSHRYLNLLTSSDWQNGRWAMEEIERRKGAEAVVYQKMREILEAQKSAIKSDLHLDYLAWICKLLSRYDAVNSNAVLLAIKNDPAKDSQTKKLKKWVKI